MEDTPYKVTLKGAGLTLERDVSRLIGEQIAVLILTGADVGGEKVEESLQKVALAKKGGAPATSIREFLNQSEPKRSPDKIAVIAAYLQDHGSKDTFSKQDVEKGFEAAAEAVPANLPRDMSWAIRAGWIAEKSGSKGLFYLTNSGKDAVARKFPKELLKKTRIEPQNKKSANKGTPTP